MAVTQGSCETCKHWDQDPDNTDLSDTEFGECQMADGRTKQARVMMCWARDTTPPSGWLETHKDFGCALYERK